MAKILKLGKTLRNNWKKSAFGVAVLCYAGLKTKEKYDINTLMREACKEAAVFGKQQVPTNRSPTIVTVLLNPVANKRKAKQNYLKYCEPLLHLAGLRVDVVQTTSEGSAKEIIERLHGTEAIIIAGGDGTISETVTGLLRRNDGANQFPLGILPLGSSNTLANILFPKGDRRTDHVKQLIDASMAIIKGDTEWKDVMKIEPQDGESNARPIYAMSSMMWGAFRDSLAKKDKYWFCGPLREYATYIFNGYKNSLTWNCSGEIKYTPPCAGCNNCVAKKPETKSRWLFFMPTTKAATHHNQNVLNPNCTTQHELCFKTCDFQIKTSNLKKNNDIPALTIELGRHGYSYSEFVSEGWNRIKGSGNVPLTIAARTIELIPKSSDNVIIEIDKEEFEVKPIKITLLPKVIKLYCHKNKNN